MDGWMERKGGREGERGRRRERGGGREGEGEKERERKRDGEGGESVRNKVTKCTNLLTRL